MKLILTRHGKTAGNTNGIIQDQLAGELTEEGIRQARKVAERLALEKIDYIYSSDAVRAADTAKEIGKRHPGVSMSFVPDLRERHFGEFIGMKKDELSIDAIYLEPKEGESLAQVCARVKNFLAEVFAKHGGETVLLVGHGLTNKVLVAAIEGKDVDVVKTMDHFGNTSISIFEIAEDMSYVIQEYNCMKHADL